MAAHPTVYIEVVLIPARAYPERATDAAVVTLP